MNMNIKIATAVVLSLAFAAQQRGWVSSVTSAVDANTGTVQFTIRGNNPCGAVNVDFGDGTTAVTHAIQALPMTLSHEYARTGDYTVRARGMGNCDGDVFNRVNIPRVRSGGMSFPRGSANTGIMYGNMDRNGDQIITRAEWRGTAQEFAENDWNSDGRLSGEEVRIGAIRWSEMDTNRDGVITRAEWRGTAQAFDDDDWNNDNRLSGDEVRPRQQQGNQAAMRFAGMDTNGDGEISRNEWRGNANAFDQQDWNNDGRLSGDEVRPGAQRQYDFTEAQFRRFDRNRDNYISGTEWRYEPDDFAQVDRNRDNRISLNEFLAADVNEQPGGRGRGRGRGFGLGNEPGQSFIVNNRSVWTDTGIDVRAGQLLDIDATGSIRFSSRAVDTAGPGGGGHLATARAPMPRLAIGALIGRVGNSAPFLVGANRSGLRAPATGRLYLGINDDNLSDNSGEFQVNVVVGRVR
jgi:hypothetical protein